MRFYGLPSRAPAPDSLTIIPPRNHFVNTFFSIFSTNFSPPFWALCILLSAARRTTRGGFEGRSQAGGELRPHGVFIARNVPGGGNVPRAACRPPLRPMVNRAVRREHRPCRTALAAGSRPRPTNLRKIRMTHKTATIRQSWETRASFRSIVGAACRPPVGLGLATNGQGLHACFLIL